MTWSQLHLQGADDQNRYIFVQRSCYSNRFTTPKGNRSRRVDLSKQLRIALLELRDKRMLEALMAGQGSIADHLVFPSHAGTVIQRTTSSDGTCSRCSRRRAFADFVFMIYATVLEVCLFRTGLRSPTLKSRWATARFRLSMSTGT